MYSILPVSEKKIDARFALTYAIFSGIRYLVAKFGMLPSTAIFLVHDLF